MCLCVHAGRRGREEEMPVPAVLRRGGSKCGRNPVGKSEQGKTGAGSRPRDSTVPRGGLGLRSRHTWGSQRGAHLHSPARVGTRAGRRPWARCSQASWPAGPPGPPAQPHRCLGQAGAPDALVLLRDPQMGARIEGAHYPPIHAVCGLEVMPSPCLSTAPPKPLRPRPSLNPLPSPGRWRDRVGPGSSGPSGHAWQT